MTRLTSSILVCAALPFFAFGCGPDGKTPATAHSKDCDEPVGDDCTCDDGTNSQTVCADGSASVCSCVSPSTASAPSDSPRDEPTTWAATNDSGTFKPSTTGDGKDAGTPPLMAGQESDAATAAPSVVSGDGLSPVLPKISAECPDFKTGTATIGGLSGISLQVGPKKQGTGSLIFYWHGTGSSAGEVNAMLPAAVRNEVLAQGGIIVSPQSSTGKGSDCSGTGTFHQGDFEIADLIAACAVQNYGIDPRRIYTTGCSAGGLQAGCMAAVRSSYVAAAVPNSGGLTFAQPIQDSKHIPAVMTMHGSASDKVIVAFSETSKTLDGLIKKAGGYVMNCNHGQGHCGAPAALETAGWKFMQDHPFGVKPEPYAGGIPTSYPTYCTEYK